MKRGCLSVICGAPKALQGYRIDYNVNIFINSGYSFAPHAFDRTLCNLLLDIYFMPAIAHYMN